MGDAHTRFRSQAAAHLAEVLPDDETAWMEAHAAGCSECAQLLARVRPLLSAMGHEAGHAPVSLLESWVHSPDELTPLELELLERHLAECETCRGDAQEMAQLAGAIRVAPARPTRAVVSRRLVLATSAIAAGLAAVFAIQFARRAPVSITRRPPVVTGQRGPESTGAVVPPLAQPPIVVIELRERLRGSTAESVVQAVIPVPETVLEFHVPRLFIDGKERVALRLLGADGTPVWTGVQAGSSLEAPIRPTVPPNGWSPGLYRLEIVPVAGADSSAKRSYSFKLVEPR